MRIFVVGDVVVGPAVGYSWVVISIGSLTSTSTWVAIVVESRTILPVKPVLSRLDDCKVYSQEDATQVSKAEAGRPSQEPPTH